MDYLNPGGVREELVWEMNLRLPEPMSAGGGTDENEPLGEARARAAAGHVLGVWLPLALEVQGLGAAARHLREAGGDREVHEAATSAWEEVRGRGTSTPALAALRDCVLRGMRMAGWMLSLDQGNPLRRRWRRGRIGEEAAAAGQALAALLFEAGEPADLAEMYRELLSLLDRVPPGQPPYVVDLMTITRTGEMDIQQFLEPDTPDALVRAVLYRSARVLLRTGWTHGREAPIPSLEELRNDAARHLGRAGVMVQAAVRNLPDPGPRGGHTNDLEVILHVRHAHEPDIRSFTRERERREAEAIQMRRTAEDQSYLQGP